ncbi:MAG: FHA domain-containing protein [Deltaproteobacteria bacterium]|nr:FHA domain-containing protein [Deltaproteobacteria bacterium]
MGFELTIAEGKGRGQRFEFDATDVTIGRGPDNDVVLNDAGVSRNHARITRSGASWMLADNGSANGTELNGGVIARATPLKNGDRIGVGPIIFRFDAQREQPVQMPVAGQVEGETRITSAPQRNEETRVSAMPQQGGQAKTVAPRLGAQASGGNLVDSFRALPIQYQIGLGIGAILVIAAVTARIMQPQATDKVKCPSVIGVDDSTADFTFGHGAVEVDCGNKVAFGFNVPNNSRTLFHYLASGISSPNEVEVKVNDKHLDWAPAAQSHGEPQVLSIPKELLSDDGKNIVEFDQATRGKEWQIAKVRVEVFAVTPGDLKAAQAAYERGRRKLEERRVAPRNLYDAWKQFTMARRSLEGLSPRPALYDEVAQLIKDAERDLEKKCGQLLFTAERYDRYGQNDRAQQTYREVLLYFPGDDPSSCRKKAQENLISKANE